MNVRVPREVEIGALRASVGMAEHIRVDDGWQGSFNQRTEEILIDTSLGTRMRDMTFLHEIVHMVSINYEIGMGEDDISRMANGMLEFITKLGVELNWSEIT